MSSPSSDIETYLPGGDINRASVSLPQTVKLIAAFVNPTTGAIVAPPGGTTQASFTLQDTSAYVGYAMNAGTARTPDFSLSAGSGSFGADNTARVDLLCHDYGGFTTVQASAGGRSVQLRLPKDSNGNLLPDAGWRVIANGQVIGEVSDPGLATYADEDTNPPGNGVVGDGLCNFEEFRGFMVRGEHRRTNPFQKDLFIYSNLPQNIGDANNLPVTKHSIFQDQMDANRIINFNRSNSGAGGSIQTIFDQHALMVINGGFGPGNIYGRTSVEGGSPNVQTGPIEIFTLFIRYASPPTNNTSSVDPFDDEKTRQTIGHEVGHGVNIEHRWPNEYLSGQLSVMVTGYHPVTSNTRDPAWNNIPHAYDEYDTRQIQVR